jgi:hypothetical protein
MNTRALTEATLATRKSREPSPVTLLKPPATKQKVNKAKTNWTSAKAVNRRKTRRLDSGTLGK